MVKHKSLGTPVKIAGPQPIKYDAARKRGFGTVLSPEAEAEIVKINANLRRSAAIAHTLWFD